MQNDPARDTEKPAEQTPVEGFGPQEELQGAAGTSSQDSSADVKQLSLEKVKHVSDAGAVSSRSNSFKTASPLAYEQPDAQDVADLEAGLWHGASKTVTLRIDSLTHKQLKGGVWVVVACCTISWTIIIANSCLKYKRSDNWWLESGYLFRQNTLLSSLCIVTIVVCIVYFSKRISDSLRSGKEWTKRSKRISLLYFATLITQFAHTLCWLIPNAYALDNPCGWDDWVVVYGQTARNTCLNTMLLWFLVTIHIAVPWVDRHGRLKQVPDEEYPMLLDAPYYVHIPKLLLWAAFEALIVSELAIGQSTGALDKEAVVGTPIPGEPCTKWPYTCSRVTWLKQIRLVLAILIVFYSVVYLIVMLRGFWLLRRLPHRAYRLANVEIRLQAKTMLLAMATVSLSSIMDGLVKPNSCATFFLNRYGQLPLQLVLAGVVIVGTLQHMPQDPDKDNSYLQELLQGFAWTEREAPKVRMHRDVQAPPGPPRLDMIARPHFCLETALKCLYWSDLIYYYSDEAMMPPGVDVEAFDRGEVTDLHMIPEVNTGMAMWDLRHAKLFWVERKTVDTKALVAWGPTAVLVAFRGTASLANVKADLSFLLADLPHGEGPLLVGAKPRVHGGFLRSWTAGGLNVTIVDFVKSLLEGGSVDRDRVQVYCTGHSLGGALSTLAAYDLQQALQLPQHRLHCYTVGAPRTGNHAFADVYARVVPETWHVINSQDTVPLQGKLLILFKRSGERVIIDYAGNLLVAPTFLEMRLHSWKPCETSVTDHLLGSYKAAFLAVLAAQFTAKRFPNGMQGVMALLEEPITRRIVEQFGFDVEAMHEVVQAAPTSNVHKKANLVVKGGKKGDGKAAVEEASVEEGAPSDLSLKEVSVSLPAPPLPAVKPLQAQST